MYEAANPPASRANRMPRNRHASIVPSARPRDSGGASSAARGIMSCGKEAETPTANAAPASSASEGAAAMARSATISIESSARIRRRLRKRSPSGTKKIVPSRKAANERVAADPADAQPVQPVLARAKKERQPLLDTLYLLARLIMDVSQGKDRQ